MLVLSRRAQQQISFPNLGVTLSILQVRGQIVKVGIEAPPEVTIKRQEMLTRAAQHEQLPLAPPQPYAGLSPSTGRASRFPSETNTAGTSAPATTAPSPPAHDAIEHWRRNQLNTLGLYLDAIQMRLDQGETSSAKSMLDTLISNLNDDNRKFAQQLDPTAPPAVASGPPIKLLVVDDSDNERGLMTLLLASYGFVVHVARDGAEAYEQLQQWSSLPDIVLMDMHMPMFNGLEALLRIREDQRLRDVTVYAVTGCRRVPENEPTGRGWDRWFAKPIDMPSLVTAINADAALMRDQRTTMNRQEIEPCPFL